MLTGRYQRDSAQNWHTSCGPGRVGVPLLWVHRRTSEHSSCSSFLQDKGCKNDHKNHHRMHIMRYEMRYKDANMFSSPRFACCMHSVNEIDIVIHKTTHIHTHDTFACIWTHTWTRAYIRRSYRAYGRILTVRCSTALVGLTLSLAVMRVGGSLPRSCPSPRYLSFLSLRVCACGRNGIVHLFLFPCVCRCRAHDFLEGPFMRGCLHLPSQSTSTVRHLFCTCLILTCSNLITCTPYMLRPSTSVQCEPRHSVCALFCTLFMLALF